MPTETFELTESSKWQGCVLAYGHFSTIHPGHIRYLRNARNLGEALVVALIGDGCNDESYPFNQGERAEALSMLGIADAVLLLQANELDQAVTSLMPKVLVLGNEFRYDDEIKATLDQQRKQGGSVQFQAGEIHYATADLLNGSERDLRKNEDRSFKQRAAVEGIELHKLLEAINGWGIQD